MARIAFAMLTSLDGYIAGPDGDISLPVPEEAPHWHFNENIAQLRQKHPARDLFIINEPGIGYRLEAPANHSGG